MLIYDIQENFRENLINLHIKQITKLHPQIKILMTFRYQPDFLQSRSDYQGIKVGPLKNSEAILLTRLYSMGPIDEQIERKNSWWNIDYLKDLYK